LNLLSALKKKGVDLAYLSTINCHTTLQCPAVTKQLTDVPFYLFFLSMPEAHDVTHTINISMRKTLFN